MILCAKQILRAVLTLAGFLAFAAHSQDSQEMVSAKAGLDQKLGSQTPIELSFRDETGRAVRLGDYLGKKPAILVLAYYQCPNLCTLVLNALLNSAQDLKLDAGKDFDIVVVSFDPREKPALAMAKKRTYSQRYGRPGAADGWHFLTGEEPAIASLAGSVGYHYVFDPATGQYAHPSAIMVLTPGGKVSRYFAGIEYPPRELRLALMQAADQRIGSLTDQLFLLCFHYNPLTGKYGLIIMRVVRIACFATVASLAFFLATMFRRDRRQLTQAGTGS
jgi:protein SCO1/2